MSSLAIAFPVDAFHPFGFEGRLLVALLIGVGFGFMLERGGFGSSKVLAGIFYLRDWRVLKVMFTAIVTAMVGLYTADGLGLVAMDQISFRSTYLWAQVVGGFVLGVGFVTAGYCPGTSVVGAVSGKLDALFVILGIVLGIGVFEEAYPLFSGLYSGTYLGEVSLQGWFGLPTALVIGAVAAMALGAFAAVGWFERRAEGRKLSLRAWGAAAALVASAAIGAGAQLAGPGRDRALTARGDATNVPSLAPLELAGWVVEERPGYMVLDLRDADAAVDVPGAIPIAADVLRDLRRRPLLPRDRALVVVDAADEGLARAVAASLRASGLRASALEGGAAAWRAQVLDEESTDVRARALRLRTSGENPFGGAPPPPPKSSAPPPTRQKKKGGGCS